MWIAGMLIGIAIGVGIDVNFWLFGALIGGIAGRYVGDWIASAEQRTSELSNRLNALASELAELRRSPNLPSSTPSIAVESPLVPSASIAEAKTIATPPAELAATTVALEPLPTFPDFKPNAVMQWLLGGNTVVRVGIVILFFGIAFLLKYSYEHTHIPLTLRLMGVAAGALLLLVIGWRLRERRPDYALPLQGGGVGVLYLTIFAAFRLYDLIPASAAFPLLVVIVAVSALLAVVQNSLPLAAFGVSGGFLAPVLISTGQGNHVILFSYYLILNLGILAISWAKAWRILNVLGFAFTFVIGGLWGWKFYGPDYFNSTEPFLIAFFLLYVAVACLFARKQAAELKYYVDGTLVFGVPLVVFGLQSGLVKAFEYGTAWSAFVLAAFYGSLAAALWRQTGGRFRLLAESFLALAVGFGTLTLPLACDGRMTSAAWALEGAAIVWVGMRQNRVLARSFGLALQFLAGVAFLSDIDQGYGTIAVLNSFYLGCTFIAAGALFCSAYIDRKPQNAKPWESGVSGVLLLWGVLWWAAGGLHEIHRHVDAEFRQHAALLFLVASAAAFSVLSRALAWPRARWPAYAILPVGIVFAADGFFDQTQPAANLGVVAWPASLLLHLWVLRTQQGRDAKIQSLLHAVGLWLLAFVSSRELDWQIEQVVVAQAVWPLIAWAVMPSIWLGLMTAAPAQRVWPLALHARSYLWIGAIPLAIYLGVWTVCVNLSSNGDPAPLPYLPLLNPLDLAQALVFAVVAYWLLVLRRLDLGWTQDQTPKAVFAVFGVASFIWANGILLRPLHHWASVPFDRHSLFHSVMVQSAVSLLWTVLALALMVTATRRVWRSLWLVGAGLMAAVVVKLFLIDLSNVDGIERIVSFIGVGVLMLVVGYFSPLPPKTVTSEPAGSISDAR